MEPLSIAKVKVERSGIGKFELPGSSFGAQADTCKKTKILKERRKKFFIISNIII
jgi:hypothetical protein